MHDGMVGAASQPSPAFTATKIPEPRFPFLFLKIPESLFQTFSTNCTCNCEVMWECFTTVASDGGITQNTRPCPSAHRAFCGQAGSGG